MLQRWLKKLRETIYRYFERVLFAPQPIDYILIILLIPISIIYGLIQYIRRELAKPKNFGIKIISVGNLVIGGSGKTPFAIELINYLNRDDKYKITYISRGYGRDSKGLVVVKEGGEITVDVNRSGDEAMVVAQSSKCDVIVSENREEAIEKAKANGSDIVILDDGFSKVDIDKFDILLEPKEIKNRFTLPAGGLREFYFIREKADLIAIEDKDFKRSVEKIEEKKRDRLLLVTSISKPERLDRYLPENIVEKYYISDHSYFNEDEIRDRMREVKANKILVTSKDYVKLEKFKLDIEVLKLKLHINFDILERIEGYINEEKNGDGKDST